MGEQRVVPIVARPVVVFHRGSSLGVLAIAGKGAFTSLSCFRRNAEANMPEPLTVIREDERPVVPFPGGATYRTLIGDDNGTEIPIRTGIQTSEPGYATREHSHPYVEVLTVLEGEGEAWLDGEPERIAMVPGVTISIPAGRVHGFRVLGEKKLVTYGIHTYPKRIVNYKDPTIR
jgi:quercetin dioxygenase-like cupin family protein